MGWQWSGAGGGTGTSKQRATGKAQQYTTWGCQLGELAAFVETTPGRTCSIIRVQACKAHAPHMHTHAPKAGKRRGERAGAAGGKKWAQNR